MKEQVTTVVILEGENDQFLGVARKDNHNSWGFAGGKCENGEEPYACARRELAEETGVLATYMELRDIREYVNKTVNPPTLDTVYCYVVISCEGDITPNEELIARGEAPVKWVTPDELRAGVFGDYNEALLNKLYSL